jgi:hypothetical protein
MKLRLSESVGKGSEWRALCAESAAMGSWWRAHFAESALNTPS